MALRCAKKRTRKQCTHIEKTTRLEQLSNNAFYEETQLGNEIYVFIVSRINDNYWWG